MLSTSSKELGNRLQTPTLIGCIFLRIKLLRISSFRFSSLRSAKPSILAQFLSNWQNFFLSTSAALPTWQHRFLQSLELYIAFYSSKLKTRKLLKPLTTTNSTKHQRLLTPATRRALFCAAEPASIHRNSDHKQEKLPGSSFVLRGRSCPWWRGTQQQAHR